MAQGITDTFVPFVVKQQDRQLSRFIRQRSAVLAAATKPRYCSMLSSAVQLHLAARGNLLMI